MKRVIILSFFGFLIGIILFTLFIKINKEKESDIQERKIVIKEQTKHDFTRLFELVTIEYTNATNVFIRGLSDTTPNIINSPSGKEYITGYNADSKIILSKELFINLQDKINNVKIDDKVLVQIKEKLAKAVTKHIEGSEHVFKAYSIKPGKTFNELSKGMGLMSSGLIILNELIDDLRVFITTNENLFEHSHNDYVYDQLEKIENTTKENIAIWSGTKQEK